MAGIYHVSSSATRRVSSAALALCKKSSHIELSLRGVSFLSFWGAASFSRLICRHYGIGQKTIKCGGPWWRHCLDWGPGKRKDLLACNDEIGHYLPWHTLGQLILFCLTSAPGFKKNSLASRTDLPNTVLFLTTSPGLLVLWLREWWV